jgi:HK97 family phage prohead protease
MHFYGSIQKVDAVQRLVAGYASTEAVDSHGEVVLKAAIEAALDDYMEFANVREMHALSAVGVAEEASVDDKGLYIAAKIVDDTAWEKVVKGVYRGFSIGGKVLARDKDDKKVITKIRLDEISLVDRPSNPEARFDIWKAAGADPADAITKATAALDKIDAAVAKVQQSHNGAEIIAKALRDRDDEIDRLRKRIDELLAEPAPPKTAGAFGLMAISKEQDAGGGGFQKRQANEDELVAALGAMDPDERALLLIKAAQRLPRPVTISRPPE